MSSASVPAERLDLRLVPAAACAWFATAGGIVLGWRAAVCLAMVLVTVAALLGCAAWCGGTRLSAASIPGIAAACAVGAGFGVAVALRAHAVAAHPLTDLDGDAFVTATIELTTDPVVLTGTGPSRVLVRGELREIVTGFGATTVGGAVVVLAPSSGWQRLLPGQVVELRASVAGPLYRDLTVATLRARDAPVAVGPPSTLQRVAGRVRERFADVAERALPGNPGALLPALVVGDTSRVPADLRDDFRTAGLSHLLAVSGANVAILLGAVLLAVRAATLGPRTAVVLAAIALALFVVLARPSPSVLRAAVMGAIGLLAMVTSRRKQAVPALATAVTALLAFAPALAVDLGFTLSVFATAGLILVAPTWSDRLRAAGWPRAPAEVVGVSAAAFVVTAPIVAGMSGTVSVVALVANILVCFVIGPVTVLGAIAAIIASLWPPGAVFVAELCGPPLWWLVWVGENAAALPFASVAVCDGVAGAATLTAAIVVVVGVVWWRSARAGRTARRSLVRRSAGDGFRDDGCAAPRSR